MATRAKRKTAARYMCPKKAWAELDADSIINILSYLASEDDPIDVLAPGTCEHCGSSLPDVKDTTPSRFLAYHDGEEDLTTLQIIFCGAKGEMQGTFHDMIVDRLSDPSIRG